MLSCKNTRIPHLKQLRFWAVLPVMLAALLASPALAVERVATLEEITQSYCEYQLYQALDWNGRPDHCASEMFFLPASAALKCGLYREAGYPSGLMRKACLLFDQGVIEYFLEGAEVHN